MPERIIGGLWTHRLVDFDSQKHFAVLLPQCGGNYVFLGGKIPFFTYLTHMTKKHIMLQHDAG